MAGPAGTLRRWLLLALVLAAHAAALEWLARQREPLSVLASVAPPMLTRLLQAQAPPAAPPPPPPADARPRRSAGVMAVQPHPAASAPLTTAEKEAPAPAVVAQAPRAEAGASIGPAAAPEIPPASPEPAASAPIAPASASEAAARNESAQAPAAEPAASAASAASTPASAVAAPVRAASDASRDDLRSWPTDTRLSYRVGGRFRSGDLYGDASVLWQRTGADYQVRIDIDITLWAQLVITSQGEVTPQGLRPRAYEEIRTRKRRGARFGDTVLALENGKTAPRPDGMQDTASQFVDLAHRFASGRERLEVGRSVTFWMARPGAVDLWTYDIVEREILQTPNFGAIETYRLKPRPITRPRGNITAEMWFAPSLQYLPVRIKVLMGDEAYVDLLVDKIEQR